MPETGGASGQGGGGSGTGGDEPEPSGGTDGGSTDDPRSFDELVGTGDDRNDVPGGEVCERIATIQCAGEASCCDEPGRDFESCKATMKQGCIDALFLDAMTENPLTGYDRTVAEGVFTDFEDRARRCDLSVAEWGVSMNGLRAFTRGTLETGASCQPAAFDLVMPGARAAAYLLSCTSLETHACFPKLTSWSCAPREGEGGACFTDLNCLEDLFCTNTAVRDIRGGTCSTRKADGAPCEVLGECSSLACKDGTCAPRTKQNVFCLQ